MFKITNKYDFNPRAPRGARRLHRQRAFPSLPISIHAPREGRDDISHEKTSLSDAFQSTRPARGATWKIGSSLPGELDFNPRAPRGARPRHIQRLARAFYFNPRAPRGARLPCFASNNAATFISIHAPREGRDSKSEQISSHIFAKKAWIPDIFAQNAAFQSVLPLADRQKLLYLRCEPLRKFLRACASHYKIIGSSGRYVCLQPKCSILFSYFLPK